MTTGADQFIWDVQLAGYEHDRYDPKGETDYQNFIDEFEKFPWLDQLDSYQEIQQGCSPTLSVKNKGTGKDFWVSIAGDRNDHGYLVGYIYPKEKKSLFGLGKPKTIRWLEIYVTEDKRVVRNCFKLYFDRNYDKLEATIRQLEEYGQMEARN